MPITPAPVLRVLGRASALLACLALAPAPSGADSGAVLLAAAETPPAESEESPRTGGGPPPGVEVLRVRGRGIADVVTDLPTSVTSFDAATIEALGAQDVSDLSRVTPNVSIVQPGATQANFYVRGIGLADPSANSAGAVTIFQDGVALDAPAIQTGQLYDIREVEILRGPQGTGPYRNASAGAIQVHSNLPTGNFGSRLRATLGRYAADGGKGAEHALIQDYEGHVEMPLVADTLSSRFAFRLRRSDPFKTNGCGNAPPFEERQPKPTSPSLLDEFDICGERATDIWPRNQVSLIPVGLPDEVDFEDNWAARGFLRLQPPETDLDLVLNVHGSRLDQDQVFGQAIGNTLVPGAGFPFGGTTSGGYHEPDQKRELTERCAGLGGTCPPAVVERFERLLARKRPLDRRPFRGDYNRDAETTRDVWGSYLSGDFQLGDVDVSALASYDSYDRFRDHDTDFTPEILFEVAEEDEAWQSYEQIAFSGELPATPFEWELGAYLLLGSLEASSRTNLRSISATQQNAIERDFSQDTQSLGVWSRFAWDFRDDLTLEGGLRLNWERKQFALRRQQFLFGSPQPAQTSEESETWLAPTGNLILTYFWNERLSWFLKYSRGFKSGHFNALASEDIDRAPADPETNDALEAGLSGAWLDRRLKLTATTFYYRYRDYQVFLFRDVAGSPPVLEIVNATEAENYGVEVEGAFEPLVGWAPRPIEGLKLTANFAWLHGEFIDFQLRNTFLIGRGPVPVVSDFSGNQFQNSPQFKASGSLSWTFDFGPYGSLIPRYDFSWSDDVFFGVNEGRGTPDNRGRDRLPELAIGQPAYWLHDVRLTYRSPTATVEVSLWMHNVTDEVYKSFAFDASNFSAVVLNYVGDPRTMGVDVSFLF